MKAAGRLALGAAILAALAAPSIGRRQSTPRPGSSEVLRPALKTTLGKEELAAGLERLIPRLMRDGDVPGLSLVVVREGRVLWHGAFGVRDASTGARIGDDTIFEAASLSKPVFAYAVLKLVNAGKLDLDAPVAKYLPG